ncbi:tyrosine-type recombinase/integrase [Bacillus pseudomycoides]|uniref:tyrosine-type recombinase/integrase n=1 Tax=Bacillus pseudomycoides TaxID=64104 RepID=UPI000BEDE5AF|nr:tyrosine-type recombinase/integrase [Bacillus pseudomycoides]PEF21596.1 integrase [Bacillus pseudomycoides]PEO42803.1 integrase [Bacillus pseudomycoides]PGD71879.1 integrase [Bacillus pseudomycoides]PHC37667.1 integrase [Bacillus pseudomycoides]
MLLKFAIKDYLEEKTFLNLAPRTVKAYGDTLNEFQSFCSDYEIIDTEEIKERTIKSYLLYCQRERSNSTLTRNTKLQHLKSFFHFLVDEEIVLEKNNPTRKLTQAKVDTRLEVFTDEQVRQMLRYYRRLKGRDKTFHAYRGYTMLVFLLGTGARLGEMINTKWTDCDLVNHSVIFYGKLKKQQSQPLSDKLVKELCEYRIYVEKHFKELPTHVFTDHKGRPMTPNSVKLVFGRLAKIMNFKGVRVSAHTCRHYFCSKLLRNGVDAYSVSRLMRHSSIKMTERYIHIWSDTLKETNDKFNPLNSLDI